MSPAQLSVIIPCHNGAQWIERALESVRAQTHPPAEVIVVDDSSTDDSMARVESFGMEIQVLSVQSRNAAAARNAGIGAASSEWIAFLDADDEWYPHHLESVARLAGSADVAYLCACDRRYVGKREIEQYAGWPSPWPQERRGELTHVEFLEFFSRVSSFGHSGVAVRRDRCLEVGGFDESLVRRHDYEHILRVIQGHTWTFDPRAGVVYQRDTPDSISRNLVDCDYYYLQGLSNNLEGYDSRVYRAWLRSVSRAALKSAYLRGSRADQGRAWKLARRFIPRTERWILAVARRFPGLLRRTLGRRAGRAPSLPRQQQD